MRVWLRRLGARESVNARPGTDFDVVIRSGGGKARTHAVEPGNVASVLLDRRIVPVGSA